VQEGGLLEAHVDERRLHTGQDPDDPALVDVARDAVLAAALHVQLQEGRLVEHGDARLPARRVDEDLLCHRC
jgi:hypothetical protein